MNTYSLIVNKYRRRFTSRVSRGFTLVELLVVITIVGLLATMVAINVNKARVKGHVEQAKNDVNRMVVAYENYKAENLILPDSVFPVDTNSTLPTWDPFWSTTIKSKTLVPPDRSNITYSIKTSATGIQYAICAYGDDLATTYIVGKNSDINVKAQASDCVL